jgi:thiamine transport system ATP-binding protein
MLEAKDIRVRYEDGWELQADFCLAAGSWTSIVGPSGSGKSTLVQAIAGFVPLASGTIIRDGTAIHNLRPADRKISYVFQNQSLFDHLSVVENLLLAVHDLDVPKSRKMDLVKNNITRLQIEPILLNRFPRSLSGGERARIVVARALMRGHKWLILDESFAALDEILRFEIQCWIESLMIKGEFSVVSVTHQLQDARLFSDRVLQIAKGRIVCDGIALNERHSQIENPDGSMTFLGPLEYALGPSMGSTLASQSNNAAIGWESIQLKRPFLAQVGGQWVLRERGKLTLLYFNEKPASLPLTVFINRNAATVTSG